MNKKSKITLFALTILTILMLVAIVVSASPNGNFEGLYRFFGTPVTFVQNGVKKAASAVSGWFKYMFSYGKVNAEIEELREKNAQIPILEDEKERLILENSELRRILGFEDYSEDYSLVPAEIIAEDVTDWFNTFTIDRGTADGVTRGCTVISPDGLVGIVTEAGFASSKFLTIVDENNSFMCRISRSNELVRVRGVSQENLVYELRIDRLSASSGIVVGDNIVTADSGGVFPSGIMVGTVKEVTVDRDTGVVTAMVKPAVDLTLLSKVFVMLRNNEPQETPAQAEQP